MIIYLTLHSSDISKWIMQLMFMIIIKISFSISCHFLFLNTWKQKTIDFFIFQGVKDQENWPSMGYKVYEK